MMIEETMNKLIRACASALVLIVVFVMQGCAPSLTVRDSKVISPSAEKIHTMQLSYQDVAMTFTSPTCKDCKVDSFHPPELVEFGKLVVKDAKSVFAQKNIALESVNVDDGTKKKIYLPSQSPVLLLTPTSGATQTHTVSRWSSTSPMSSSKKVSYVFTAQLIDLTSGKLIWTAKIDGAAWDSPDSKSGYDEAYVSKFLSAVLGQMAKDGII